MRSQTYGIYTSDGYRLIEGGFFSRASAEEVLARDYAGRGYRVLLQGGLN